MEKEKMYLSNNPQPEDRGGEGEEFHSFGGESCIQRPIRGVHDLECSPIVDKDEDDDDSDYDADERPFDPSEIDIELKDISVFSLLERIKNKEIILDADYQRNSNLWNRYRQSQLIESMLLGIPIPTFYFAIDKDFKDELGLMRQSWQVVDGLQRLCVIRNFMLGVPDGRSVRVMHLDGMQYLKSLDGKSYEELPEALKRTLLEVNIKANVIRKSTPMAVKLNIFRRLNTGGLPLSMQEIRHAMHAHGSSRLLKKWAASHEFQDATAHKVSPKRMGDREFVNRFLAFYLLGVDAYRGMDAFLEEALARVDNLEDPGRCQLETDCLLNNARVLEIENALMSSLTTMHQVFGDDAYCQQDQTVRVDKRSKRVNKALFEVFTVCTARMSQEARQRLVKSAKIASVEHVKLFADKSEDGLSDLVSVSTGRRSRIVKRYEIVSDFLARMTGETIEWRKGLYD